ncbi:MAG: PIN domain-containing protein [Bryobacteraceae bacterium]|jgi:hypothetical protein
MPSRALVVDANILVRAVLGKRVREVMEAHAGNVSFFIPEVAYCEAEEHLAALVVKLSSWDGPPGPRADAFVGPPMSRAEAGPGVRRGPGGPPHKSVPLAAFAASEQHCV